MLLRALIWLATLVLSAGAAWAEGFTPEAVPLELQWLKVVAQIISTVGMPGVIAGLLYLLKIQRDRQDAERGELQVALKEEQAFTRKIQEDRIAAAGASAERLATVAVSSNNAITTAAEKNAGLLAICHEIKEEVAPADGKLDRILTNQDGLFGGVNALALKVGGGCRAP